MFVSDNYYLFVAFIAIGSTFPPLGIRIAYTLGKILNLIYK
jgi:fructose-specific phosphotransferase system IIC component